MRIVLTGGGTGGHLAPLVAVAKKIKEKLGPEAEFLYIGSGAELEKEFMSKENIPMKFVKSGKLRRYFSVQNFFDIFRLPLGFIKSLWILLWYMPDVVFSKGGYVAIPVVLAAWCYRIPIFIHESDSVPGIANQFLSKFATRIGVSYPQAEQYFPKEKTAFVGNPVRENLIGGDAYSLRKELGFTESRKVILILGGSQGSQIINSAVVHILPQLLKHAQILHQTGEKNYEEVVEFAASQGIKAGHEGYVAMKFLDENKMRDAYALCDLVISRAGANSIAEIAANEKPAILVPLKSSANDHQKINANEIAKIGGAIVLDETNLHEHLLIKAIEKIFSDDDFRNSMIAAVKTFHHPKATETIANGVIEIGSW